MSLSLNRWQALIHPVTLETTMASSENSNSPIPQSRDQSLSVGAAMVDITPPMGAQPFR